MNSPVTSEVLLSEVLSVLKTDILPLVSGAGAASNKKFELLMSMNAIGIALRNEQEKPHSLHHLVAELAENTSIDKPEVWLKDKIHTGGFDDLNSLASQKLFSELEKWNRQNLLISNPKFLQRNSTQ